MRFEGHQNQSSENMQHGEFFERAAFGVSSGNLDKQKGYLGFRESVEKVKENYGDDPADPEKRIANDLHALVAKELNLTDYSELKFYSAVGSELDVYHGVDGFFEYKGRQATVDITMNPEKESAKADALLQADPNAEDPKKTVPMDEMERAAGDIALQLAEREPKQKAA